MVLSWATEGLNVQLVVFVTLDTNVVLLIETTVVFPRTDGVKVVLGNCVLLAMDGELAITEPGDPELVLSFSVSFAEIIVGFAVVAISGRSDWEVIISLEM